MIIDHGISEDYVRLAVTANVEGGSIDILVQVSGELAPPANFFVGQLSDRSILAQT